MIRQLRYRSGYKYQVADDYSQTVPIPGLRYQDKFLSIDFAGLLTIKAGYAFDGVSGPVIDGPTKLRAAAVHDALYQLMRMGVVSAKKHRKTADKLFRKMCREDGVGRIRAWRYYAGLRLFGKFATDPGHRRDVLSSPSGDE